MHFIQTENDLAQGFKPPAEVEVWVVSCLNMCISSRGCPLSVRHWHAPAAVSAKQCYTANIHLTASSLFTRKKRTIPPVGRRLSMYVSVAADEWQTGDGETGQTERISTNWCASCSSGTFRSRFTLLACVTADANLTERTRKASFTLRRDRILLKERDEPINIAHCAQVSTCSFDNRDRSTVLTFLPCRPLFPGGPGFPSGPYIRIQTGTHTKNLTHPAQ